uniref:Uncharacterized protein n=1 Tax=Zea mays TaxID=4577 RepID=B8A1H2_MAIZE|nr:unknown [Zea mays]
MTANVDKSVTRPLINLLPFGPKLSRSCHCQAPRMRSCFPWDDMRPQ